MLGIGLSHADELYLSVKFKSLSLAVWPKMLTLILWVQYFVSANRKQERAISFLTSVQCADLLSSKLLVKNNVQWFISEPQGQ